MAGRKRKRRGAAAARGGASNDEARYVCGACGEEIVVPVDPSGGAHQSYVEDCPVCCRPHRIEVEFDERGEARVSAEPE